MERWICCANRTACALTWRSEPDDGQANAINKAFALSRGEIIGWLNSDDAYFGPDVVAQAVRVFEDRPDVAVVYGHALMIDATGCALQVMWVPSFDRRLLKLHDFIIQPAAFIRRSAVAKTLVDTTSPWTTNCGSASRLVIDSCASIGSSPSTAITPRGSRTCSLPSARTWAG